MSGTVNEELYVALEFTPNPNTLKYTVNRDILPSGALNFTDQAKAEKDSHLAHQLFQVEGIEAVMLGRTFVTVTKAEGGDWDLVHEACSKVIEEVLSSDRAWVESAALEGLTEKRQDSEGHAPNSAEEKIKEILDREIRPAVAMDGGDITFERFENGIVYLNLQGSCSGCPSSTATLKNGVETRLKAAVPEVVEVVST